MTPDQLTEILRLHALWLKGEAGGVQADLSGADLNGADMRRADLSKANMRWANLSGANLNGANLCEADMRRADMPESIIIGPTCYGHMLYAWEDSGQVMVRGGCKVLNLQEAREYWADKPHRIDALDALDYVEAVARRRGWGVTRS